jgi:hypothetical protein
MDFQEITVFCVNAAPAHIHGDFVLDPEEGTLVVMGEGASQVTFNWDHVAYFVVIPPEADDDED